MSAWQRRAADFDQRIENRFEIEGRAADHLEHVRRRGYAKNCPGRCDGRHNMSDLGASVNLPAPQFICRQKVSLLVIRRNGFRAGAARAASFVV